MWNSLRSLSNRTSIARDVLFKLDCTTLKSLSMSECNILGFLSCNRRAIACCQRSEQKRLSHAFYLHHQNTLKLQKYVNHLSLVGSLLGRRIYRCFLYNDAIPCAINRRWPTERKWERRNTTVADIWEEITTFVFALLLTLQHTTHLIMTIYSFWIFDRHCKYCYE